MRSDWCLSDGKVSGFSLFRIGGVSVAPKSCASYELRCSMSPKCLCMYSEVDRDSESSFNMVKYSSSVSEGSGCGSGSEKSFGCSCAMNVSPNGIMLCFSTVTWYMGVAARPGEKDSGVISLLSSSARYTCWASVFVKHVLSASGMRRGFESGLGNKLAPLLPFRSLKTGIRLQL